MIPILINKDVFEPSYNDVKFTVWNHNYFYTNPTHIDRPKMKIYMYKVIHNIFITLEIT